MGSSESSEARRVSFGMDEEERVRVLQGIRLSESVVNRMKDSSQPSAGQQPTPASAPTASTPSSAGGPSEGTSKAPQTDCRGPRAQSSGGKQPSAAKESLKRFQQEQAAVQDELVQVAKKEKEAAEKHLKASLPKKMGSSSREQWQSAWLDKELENREAELSHSNTFYKEQLERIEKKNAEMYKLSSQQFHEAASKAENTIKPRRVEPVCSGLQAQILRCYRDHVHEVLLCSDLAKAYQHCVSAASKG